MASINLVVDVYKLVLRIIWGFDSSKFLCLCHFSRYVRAEVIAGFVNGLFLLFVAFFIFAEAIEVSKEEIEECSGHV